MDYSSLSLKELAYYCHKKNDKINLVREIRDRFTMKRPVGWDPKLQPVGGIVGLGLFEAKMMADGLFAFMEAKLKEIEDRGFDKGLQGISKWEEAIKVMEVQNALDRSPEPLRFSATPLLPYQHIAIPPHVVSAFKKKKVKK